MSRRPSFHLHLISFRFSAVSTDAYLIKTSTLFIYLFIYSFIHLLIYLFIYLFTYSSVYLFIYSDFTFIPTVTYCRGGSNSQKKGSSIFVNFPCFFQEVGGGGIVLRLKPYTNRLKWQRFSSRNWRFTPNLQLLFCA